MSSQPLAGSLRALLAALLLASSSLVALALPANFAPIDVTISGIVVDSEEQPLGGLRIELQERQVWLDFTETDANGRFTFTTPLLPGSYSVVAWGEDDELLVEELFDWQWPEVQPTAQRIELKLVVPAPEEEPTAEEEPVASSPTPPRSGYMGSQEPASTGADVEDDPYSVVRVFYATDRLTTGPDEDDRFYDNTKRRAGGVELGTCDVSIPRDHRLASLESPSIWRLEFEEDPSQHVVLLSVHPEAPGAFYAQLQQKVADSTRKELFVFVHGFNTSFEFAVRTAAQLSYDLQFDGAPVVFSWPSGGGLMSYRGAEASAVKAVDSLVGFLRDLAAKGGATSIHLVAHSMGGRVTSQAVARLAELESARLPLFHQVVLAAPDIDLEAFRQLSAAMTKASGRLTVYASANDVALSFSEMLHSDRRAGKNAAALASVPGVDVVDASGVDSSFIGHQYYGESTSVVSDVFWLLRVGAPPDRRRSLRPLVAGVGKIWQLVTGAPATP